MGAFLINKSRADERKHLVLQGAAVCNRRPTWKAIENRLSLKLFAVSTEINLECPNPARYFWRQFFVSFDQWTGARNSREIREQLRCCNWIRLPMSQSL